MKSNSFKSGESKFVLLQTDPTFISVRKFMAQIWWSDCKLLEHMHKSIAALLKRFPPPLATHFGKNRPYLWPKIITSNPHFKIFHWHLCYDLLNWPKWMAVQYLCCTRLHTLSIATIGPFIAFRFWLQIYIFLICSTCFHRYYVKIVM